MADKWYYVQKGNRHGPVAFEVILELIENRDLGTEEFVWKKGFETWKKIKEVEELQRTNKIEAEEVLPPEISVSFNEVSLKELTPDERNLYVRIGADRGSSTTEYGPFSLNQVQKLFKENRINGKTFLFIKGTNNWKMLADFKDYEEVFEEVPPVIKESERRMAVRKPFIARIFFNNDKKFFEGICRDISVGGMQVLVDGFNGNIENIMWIDGEHRILGKMLYDYQPPIATSKWEVNAADASIQLTMLPKGARKENINVLLMKSRFTQVYGPIEGFIRENDKLVKVSGFGVMEEHEALW
jgi:hypothetical protein